MLTVTSVGTCLTTNMADDDVGPKLKPTLSKLGASTVWEHNDLLAKLMHTHSQLDSFLTEVRTLS